MGAFGIWVVLCVSAGSAQDAPATNPGAPATQPRQGRAGGDFEGGTRPLLGKITAVHEGSMEITKPDGGVVVVKLTNQTVYRKDRADAKLTDFKVGEVVMVRGDQNPDHSVTAKLVGGRTGGPGGGMMWSGGGTLGRSDYLQLERPSENVPVTYFATVEPGLYRAILTRCVDPESRSCMTRVDLSPHESSNMPMNSGQAGVADTLKPQPHSD